MTRFLLSILLVVVPVLSRGADESAPAEVIPNGVWIVADITPLDFTWNNLGLEHESSFTTPLIESWRKWLQENQTAKAVHGCLDQCLTFHSQWLDQGAPLLKGQILPPEYAGGLWLKLSIKLRRDQYSGKFQWEGSAVLMDINSKLLILSSDLPREERSWIGLAQKELNSQLATRIYQSALPALKVVAGKLPEELSYSKASYLVIRGGKQMGDALKLVEILKNRGQKVGLVVRWEYSQQSEARFHVFYRGEEKSFTDLLSQVKELKSSHSYEISYERAGPDHVLTLNAQ